MATCQQQHLLWSLSTDENFSYLPRRNNFRYSTNRLTLIIRSTIFLLISEIPFLTFLAAYGANNVIRVLPTFDDATRNDTFLYDVTAWERVALSPLLVKPLPRALHQTISNAHCTALDLLAAVPYLIHYTLPVVCPLVFVFVFRREHCARRFNVLLGVTMWVFYSIWFFLPTAPPWYRESLYVTAADHTSVHESQTVDVPPGHVSGFGGEYPTTLQSLTSLTESHGRHLIREGMAFARLDLWLDVAFFRSLFAGNPVPFGAFPSGHVAWPTCFVMCVPVTEVCRYRRIIIGSAYVSLVAWATLYTGHHYAADVIAAVVIVFIANWTIVYVQQVPGIAIDAIATLLVTSRSHGTNDVSFRDDIPVDNKCEYVVNAPESSTKYYGGLIPETIKMSVDECQYFQLKNKLR